MKPKRYRESKPSRMVIHPLMFLAGLVILGIIIMGVWL